MDGCSAPVLRFFNARETLPPSGHPHLPRARLGQSGSPLDKVRGREGTEIVADLEGGERGEGGKGATFHSVRARD